LPDGRRPPGAFLARPADSREALEERFRTIAQAAGGTVGVSVAADDYWMR
jgi:hypothetical protein